MSYLVETLECERRFLGRLGWSWDSLAPMLRSLGIHPRCCWALIEVQMEDLVPSVKGDVDILVGSIAWTDPSRLEAALRDHIVSLQSLPGNALIQFVAPDNLVADLLAEEGEVIWPPAPDYLVGIEVKSSRLDRIVNPLAAPISVDDMKSTKASPKKKRKIRLEIDKLLRLGCDRVGLLDLIANPPADGINMRAWHNASITSEKTETAMAAVLADRLPVDSVAGHWVYSVGAVAGADETVRGTGLPQQYKEARLNTISSEPDSLRRQLNEGITNLLSTIARPYSLPALFLNCRLCKRIHHALDMNCPECAAMFSNIPALQ
jgi:hypothetical protein